MSIGKTGKRAQQLGRAKLQRHKVQTGSSDTTPLRAPVRRDTDASTPAEVSQPDTIQRADDDAPTATNTSTANTVQAPASGQQANAQALAEKVYELMKKDLRIQRERFGRMRR